MSKILLFAEEDVLLPQRATKYSAGYDVFAHQDILIPAKGTVDVSLKTWVKFNPETHKVLVFLRSSMGIKRKLRLQHVSETVPFPEITLYNAGTEDVVIKKGTAFLQYVITNKETVYFPFVGEKVKDLRGIQPVSVFVRSIGNHSQQLVLNERISISKEDSFLVPSGYKFCIPLNTVLFGKVPDAEKRFAYGNGTAVIDADYYNNQENEGHCFFHLENRTEEDLELEPGTVISELFAVPYYTAENEIPPTKVRAGGIGSTS